MIEEHRAATAAGYPPGPYPGVRWRGGQPPTPPVLQVGNNDPGALARWERALGAWKDCVRFYVPMAEAGYMLYDSLTHPDAVSTLQAISMQTIGSEEGIQAIVDALQEPFGEEVVLRKGSFMDAYEYLERKEGEPVRKWLS